jgi:hypothetical protein
MAEAKTICCYLNLHAPMITTSTSPFLYIDWGDDEPGMTLQRREDREGRYLVWRDYKVNGELVKSPVDIDALPHW